MIDNKHNGLNVLKPEDDFCFECTRQLDCFTRCCRNVNIFLMPYDIIQLKNCLNILSGPFLQKYTYTLMGESGLPVVGLKMNDDEQTSCPFVTDSGCAVYESRPWACRVYPLQPESTKITERKGKVYYSIMDVPFCLGFKSDTSSTVKGWLDQQNVPVYQEMESLFKDITTASFLSDKTIENKQIQKMFFMACYDIDQFRQFVFETSFLKQFDIEEQEIVQIRRDDTALYRFAMRWIEFGLLKQQGLKLKPSVMLARKEKLGIK